MGIKKVESIEAQACPDHIYMLVRYTTISEHSRVYEVSQGQALMIFDRHANVKYRYGRRNFWRMRYFGRYSSTKRKSDNRIYKKTVERR